MQKNYGFKYELMKHLKPLNFENRHLREVENLSI